MSNNTASSSTIEYGKTNVITIYGDKWERKKTIERLFRKENELWYSDIAEILGLDLRTVVDICKELIEEGKIEEC